MDGIKLGTLVVLLLMLISVSYLTPYDYIEKCKASNPDPPTFYVDDDAEPSWYDNEHFGKIQDAINNASSGDRILVHPGDYPEHLIINSTVTSLSLFGEDKSSTIITGGYSGDVITISAAGVDISGFTIKSSGISSNEAAIKLNASNCVITDNIIFNSGYGVYIYNCSSIKIYYNIITDNSKDGIYLENSTYNITYTTITSNDYNGIFSYSCLNNSIENCTIRDNGRNGIYLNATCNSNTIATNNVSDNTMNGVYLNDHCDGNIIGSNSVYSNDNSGIKLENSSSNNLGNNIVNGNSDYGIMALGSSNSIHNSTINNNIKHGVFLFGDDNNNVTDNNIQENIKDGIRIQNSTSDKIYGNEICGNSQYGIYLNYFSTNNLIYNNYFHNNSDNALDMSENNNVWYISTTTGHNIVNGANKNVAGNYWDDFDEASEGAIDSDNNGVVNTGISKSINIFSSDNAAIVDILDPTVKNISVSPSSQTLGSYTYISATIRDNTEIKDVRLIVTNPEGQTSNFSITQNKTGDTYFCNKQFLSVGNYSFRITAKDPRNWANSSNVTFYIHEGEPPIIVDNSPTTSPPNSNFTFNVIVTSSETSTSDIEVYVIWNHTSKWKNQSMINVVGNYFEQNVSLNKSIDDLRYHFYARDRWGNAVTSDNKTVTITDTQPPSIEIERYGPSFEDFPNSHTFGVTVTDDSAVSNVSIEYWYSGSSNMISDMDCMGNNYYKKVIFSEATFDDIYCVIYANDTSGNSNNTKNPTSISGGPYSGSVLEEITFNGTDSFDLDGEITNFLWNFGDGTTGNTSAPTHTYYSNGNYVITLTVTDNDDRTHTSTTQANIISFTKIETSDYTMNSVSSTYNLNLTEKFYGYDTDGDGMVDTFFDPNDKLTSVHNCHVNISGIISFLLSVDDDETPECLWNTFSDEITPVSYFKIQVDDDDIVEDDENEQVTMIVTVEKANWIYIEVDDKYPESPLTVKRGDGSNIYSDMIWRKSDKIYILDDPDTEYHFVFKNIFPELKSPTFSPVDGCIINENSTTITISYNAPVKLTYAAFGSSQIESNLITTDNKIFTYTPLPYLDDGVYTLEIDAQALHGNDYVSSSATYIYFAYAEPPQESFIEKNWMWIALGVTITILVTAFFAFKYKLVIIDDFIYIKNKKILPFFKTIIFGPVSVNVDSDNISKAEFYIDGRLKDALTSPPYLWKWNEKAYLKHTLETKIYDKEGNDTSSGEMTFYIFNPFKSR